MSAATGVDDVIAGRAANLAEQDGNDLMKKLDEGFKAILTTYEQNWGTEDGKNWVNDTCLPRMNELSKSISDSLTFIAQTIANTANDEIGDSSNTQHVNVPDAIGEKAFTAAMQDKLSDGHIGVYIDLPDLAETASTTCENDINAAIGKLQSDVIPRVEEAFRESGQGSTVYAQVMAELNSIKSGIETAMSEFRQKVTTSAENAEKFAHNIQAKGITTN